MNLSSESHLIKLLEHKLPNLWKIIWEIDKLFSSSTVDIIG